MLGIHVEKTKDELIISWQFSKIHIALCEITEVTEDNTYAGEEEKATGIGTAYGTTDRILIKTVKQKLFIIHY